MMVGPHRSAAGTASSRQGRQHRAATGHRAGRNAPGPDQRHQEPQGCRVRPGLPDGPGAGTSADASHPRHLCHCWQQSRAESVGGEGGADGTQAPRHLQALGMGSGSRQRCPSAKRTGEVRDGSSGSGQIRRSRTKRRVSSRDRASAQETHRREKRCRSAGISSVTARRPDGSYLMLIIEHSRQMPERAQYRQGDQEEAPPAKPETIPWPAAARWRSALWISGSSCNSRMVKV
jgi:hypothetical protein